MSTRQDSGSAWRATAHAAALGALSGGRALQPLRQLSKQARSSGCVVDRGPWPVLRSAPVRVLLGLASFAELFFDKLPGMPSRLALPGLAGRCVTGAVAGAAAFTASRRPALAGMLVGALAAYAGARVGHRFRVRGDERGRAHPLRGIVEDTIVVRASSRVARATVLSAGSAL